MPCLMAWMAWMAWLAVFALCADAKPRELFEVGPEDQATGLEPFYDGNMATGANFHSMVLMFLEPVCHMSDAAHLGSCRIVLYLLISFSAMLGTQGTCSRRAARQTS